MSKRSTLLKIALFALTFLFEMGWAKSQEFWYMNDRTLEVGWGFGFARMGRYSMDSCKISSVHNNTNDDYNDGSFTTGGRIFSFLDCFVCFVNGTASRGVYELGIVSAFPFLNDSLIGVYPGIFVQNYDTLVEAMTCDYANNLYLAGAGVMVFDPAAEQFDFLGYLPPDMRAGGAMTYRDGRLLLTTVSHTLVEINQANPMASQTLYTFPDTVPPIHAMVSFPYRCDSIVTFAIGTDSSGSRIYRFDLDSYALTEVCQTDRHLYGATARQSCWRPPCELQAVLDEDGSSLAAAPGDYRDTICRTPVPVADADLRLNAVLDLDSIEIILDGVLDAGMEYLSLAAAPPVPVAGEGTARLVLYSPGGASTADFEQALSLVRYNNDAPSPAYGERQIHVLPRSGIYSGIITHAYLLVDTSALQVQINAVDPACYGFTGAVDIAASGTQAPYQYSWSDGVQGPQRNDLPAGEHYFTVTDALGCSRSLSLTLGQPDSLSVSISGAGVACGNTGTLSAQATGGTTPYNFQWSNGDSGPQAGQLGGGLHSLTLTDAQGCTAIAQAQLQQIDTVFTQSLQQRCAGEAFEYEGQSYYADTTLCGYYSALSGCDSVHCISVQFLDTFRIVNNAQICAGETYYFYGLPLAGDTTMCINFNTVAGCDSVICLNLEVIPTHVELAQSICQGETYVFAGQPLSEPGMYPDTLVGVSGCDSILILHLEVIPPPTLQWSTLGSLCRGEPVLLSPGIHQTYLWSDGSTGPNLQVSEGGSYGVTVIGPGGCAAQGGITLSDDALSLSAVAVPPACYGFADGSISAEQPLGGLPPYRYRLVGRGGWQSSPIFVGLTAGAYTLEAEDAAGCLGVLQLTLAQPNALALDLGADIHMHLGDSITLNPQTNAANAALAQWSPPEGLRCDTCVYTVAQPLRSTLYSLTMTDTAGCRVEDALWVFVERQAGVFVPNALSPNADGINDVLVIFADASVSRLLRLRIFDRWGALLADVQNPQPETPVWDAKGRGGKPVPAGVYVYVLELERLDGQWEQVSGEVAIIR